jgi:exopolyphosphatase/guanosine-5'-triphosphate,3'-diphosphate pyrophosphatase
LKIHLVRHARAVPRDEWDGEDLLRPLNERGFAEAAALAEHFAKQPPARIVSAPELRCQQTVEALAVAADLDVEVDERLAAGEEVDQLLELFPAGDSGPVLLCTHAPLITSALSALELAEPERGGRIPCKKGSVWLLEGGGVGPTRASYFEPVRRARRGNALTYAERESPRARTVRAAVLDLGSTSFTLLVADVTGDGEIHPLVGEKVMLRLGAAIAVDGVISEEVGRRAVSVARQLHGVAHQEKAQVFLAVATAAVREAANGHGLAARISQALGQPIRILSGEEEARLIFHAFRRRMDLGPETVLGLDLGGGSLELAVGSSQGIALEATLPLGAVRLAGELVHGDPMRPVEARAVRERVRSRLAPQRAAIRAAKPADAIATGGTVRALGRLVAERRGERRPRGSARLRLSAERLRELADELAATTHRERIQMRGVRRRRADLLPTGALVLSTLVEELDLDGLTICDWGLREGVLLDALAREAEAARTG